MKPALDAKCIQYNNPGTIKLSTANLANIDAAIAFDAIYPYAYSATVQSHDAYNFTTKRGKPKFSRKYFLGGSRV